VAWSLATGAFYLWSRRNAVWQAKQYAYGNDTVGAMYVGLVAAVKTAGCFTALVASMLGLYFAVRFLQ
jgi:hypothetical protein